MKKKMENDVKMRIGSCFLIFVFEKVKVCDFKIES